VPTAAPAALLFQNGREDPGSPVKIAGCSAGSVGSAFHADSIIRPDSKAHVAQLGDSLAFIFHRPIRLVDWGAHEHFPRFFRIGNRRFTMVHFVTALARAHPKQTFARFNHAEDNVQERFYRAVGGRQAASRRGSPPPSAR
jgi:hypothetical protein